MTIATTLLNAVTATGAGLPTTISNTSGVTFQASGTTTAGAGAATVVIQVSNDGLVWLTLGTITLTLGTTIAGDGFAADAPWGMARANVTAISGTGASVSAYVSGV